VRAARALGGPVALKLDGDAFLHKSDVGGVLLGLEGDASVRDGAERLADVARRAAPGAPHGLVVQRMAAKGTELVLGVSSDPVFGPLLVVGLGGVFVEVLEDVRFGLVPLTPALARRMLRRLKSFPILEGARGGEPVDLAAVEHALLCLSQLVEEHPEIAECDVNPLIARPDGVLALDARVRVAR
jgi:acyl-CoA synthetase (NDP forming)